MTEDEGIVAGGGELQCWVVSLGYRDVAGSSQMELERTTERRWKESAHVASTNSVHQGHPESTPEIKNTGGQDKSQGKNTGEDVGGEGNNLNWRTGLCCGCWWVWWGSGVSHSCSEAEGGGGTGRGKKQQETTTNTSKDDTSEHRGNIFNEHFRPCKIK